MPAPFSREIRGLAKQEAHQVSAGRHWMSGLEHDALPEIARRHIKLVEAPVDIISTGPDSDQTIILRHQFQ